jgi:hypothetical protein
MTCSSTNWRTISVIAFCSSVLSLYGVVATAILFGAPGSLNRAGNGCAGGYCGQGKAIRAQPAEPAACGEAIRAQPAEPAACG